jgi:hypothetical protein
MVFYFGVEVDKDCSILIFPVGCLFHDRTSILLCVLWSIRS